MTTNREVGPILIKQLPLKEVFKLCGTGRGAKKVHYLDKDSLSEALRGLNFETGCPYHPSFEKVFRSWIYHVDSLKPANKKNCLIEEAKLLQQCSKIYVCRMDRLYQCVQELAKSVKRVEPSLMNTPTTTVDVVIQNGSELLTGSQQETPSSSSTANAEAIQPRDLACFVAIERLSEESIRLHSSSAATPSQLSDEMVSSSSEQGGSQVIDIPVSPPSPALNQPGESIVNNNDAEFQISRQENYLLQREFGLNLRKKRISVAPRKEWCGTPKKRRRTNVSPLRNMHREGVVVEGLAQGQADDGGDETMIDRDADLPAAEDSLLLMLLSSPLTSVFVECDKITLEEEDHTLTNVNKFIPRSISVPKEFVTKLLATNINGLSSGEVFFEFVHQVSQVCSCQISCLLDFMAVQQQQPGHDSSSCRVKFRKLWKEYTSYFISENVKKYSAGTRLAFLHQTMKQKLDESAAALQLKVHDQIEKSLLSDDNDAGERNNETENIELLCAKVLKAVAEEETRVDKLEHCNIGLSTPQTRFSSKPNVSCPDSGFISGENSPSSNPPCTPATESRRPESYFLSDNIYNPSQDSGIEIDHADHDIEDDEEMLVEDDSGGRNKEEEDQTLVFANCIFNTLEEVNNKNVALRFYCLMHQLSDKKITAPEDGNDTLRHFEQLQISVVTSNRAAAANCQ